MSTLHRFDPAPRNRCATPLWMKLCTCTTGCKVHYEASAIVTALAWRRAAPTARDRTRLSNTVVRVGIFSRAVAIYRRSVLCSPRLLLRYEIDCNGQDQKADRQFDHGILQRRVKRL